MASDALFCVGGHAMVFYMPMGEKKQHVRNTVTSHGGRMASKYSKDCITLVPHPVTAARVAKVGPLYLAGYVDACVEAGTLLPLSSYSAVAGEDGGDGAGGGGSGRGKSGKRKRGVGRSYTPAEDAVILVYAEAEGAAGAKTTGIKVWKKAEALGLLARSAGSMRERWRRHIIDMTESRKKRLRAIAADAHTDATAATAAADADADADVGAAEQGAESPEAAADEGGQSGQDGEGADEGAEAPAAKRRKNMEGSASPVLAHPPSPAVVAPMDIEEMDAEIAPSTHLYVDGKKDSWLALASMQLSDSDDEAARSALLSVHDKLASAAWLNKNKNIDLSVKTGPKAGDENAAPKKTPKKADKGKKTPEKADKVKEAPKKSPKKADKGKSKSKSKKSKGKKSSHKLGREDKLARAQEQLEHMQSSFRVPLKTLVKLVFDFNGSLDATQTYLEGLVADGAKPGKALRAKIKAPFSAADDAQLLLGTDKAIAGAKRKFGAKQVEARIAYLQSRM